jgi:hypothetical protein
MEMLSASNQGFVLHKFPDKLKEKISKQKPQEEEEELCEEEEDDMIDEFLSLNFDLEEQTEVTKEENGFLQDSEEIFMKRLQNLYPTISQKCLQGILWKRNEILNVLCQTTNELLSSNQEYTLQLNAYIQKQHKNNPLSEKEISEKVSFLNQRIVFWMNEIKKTCENSLCDYIFKLGKRRNRALPVDSTLILKEWFLNNIDHP